MCKKIVVLGSSGMAGHIISQYLQTKDCYEIINVARDNKLYHTKYNIDIENYTHLTELSKILLFENPQIIINCIGLLVGDSNTRPDRAIYINSYFPHWIENIFKKTNTTIIHLSTDCVFSGKKGNYNENDIKDGEDWYAKSKSLGEIVNNKDLTIRTSIIGTELKSNGTGLLQWCLKQKGVINGYSDVWWNGVTTLELAKFIDYIINKNQIANIYQLISPYKINKYDLLNLICKHFEKIDIIINSINEPKIDKTLLNNRHAETNYKTKDYSLQLIEMYEFTKQYFKIII